MANGVEEYLQALSENPNDTEALASAERAYSGSEAWTDLVAWLPVAARKLDDPVERVRYLSRAAHVCRFQVDDDASAQTYLAEVLASGLNGDDLVRAVTLAYSADQEWEGLISTLMELVGQTEDGAIQARIYYAAGRTYEDRLFDPTRAIPLYQRAFKHDPLFTEPLHAARQVYGRNDQWSTVARLYDIEIKLTQDARTKARLLKEVGQVHLDRLSARDEAVARFREALELDPDLVGLQSIISQLEDEAPQGVIISDLADEASTPGRDPEIVASADLEAVDDEPTARETDTGHGESSPVDASPADTSGLGETAADATSEGAEEVAPSGGPEPADTHSDEPDVAEAASVESATDEESVDAADSVDAVDTREPTPSAAEPRGSEPAAPVAARPARAVATPAIRPRASSRRTTSEIEPVAPPPPLPEIVDPGRPVVSAGADIEEYLAALVEQAASLSNDDALPLVAEAIEIGLRLGRPEGLLADWAFEAIQAASDSRYATALLLPALYGQTGVWNALVGRLHEVDTGDPDSGLAGALYASHFYALGDPESAAAYADRAGGYVAVESAVLDFALKGNWRKTQQGLVTAFEPTFGDGAENEAYRASAFIALGLGNTDKAVDSMRRILRKEKSDAGALALMKALYAADEKWSALADAVKSEAQSLGDEHRFRKILLYQDLIGLYRDRLEQDVMVMSAYQWLLEVDETNVEVMDELADKLRELNRFPDLVDLLKKKAEVVTEPEARIAILMEVATTLMDRFTNIPEANKAYEQILEIDPSHHPSLKALEDGYDKRREWDALIDVKRRLVDLSDDDAERAQLWRDAADIAATRKRDPDHAVELWNEVLRIDAHDEAALGALEQLYERSKSYAELADVLSRRIGVLDDPKEKAQTLLKLGQIYADRLSDQEAALEAFEQLLEIEPDNFRAKDAVKKSYIELERWDSLEAFFARDEAWAEYVRQLESLAGSVDDDEKRIDLLFRAADVWVERLDELPRATKNLERVLQADPQNRAAAERLAPTYEERGDFRRLPGTLEIVLAHEEDPARRFDLQLKLARIHSERLRDEDSALQWYAAALSECPERSDIYEEYQTCAGKHGSWSAVEGVFSDVREALSAAPSSHEDALIDVSLRLGNILDEHLDRADDALERFDDVLTLQPTNTQAIEAKDAIFTRLERWDELLDVIEVKLSRTEDLAEQISLRKRTCEIHETHRDDMPSAIDGYNAILATDPANEAALTSLQRLYSHVDDYNALADVLERMLTLHTRDADEARWKELQRERGRVLSEHLDAHDVAIGIYAAVLEVDPSDESARAGIELMLDLEDQRQHAAELLEPLYERDAEWSALVGVLEIQLESDPETNVQTALLQRIAEAHLEHLGNADAAFDAYARLLRADPSLAFGREKIETIASTTGNWRAVVELYESLIDEVAYSGEDGTALALTYAESVATFFDKRLGEIDEAVRVHRRILELAPGHRPALDALDDLHTRAEQWDELLSVCEERLQTTEDATGRRTIHFQAASILEHRLADIPLAIEEYRRVLSLQPDDAEALEALDRLYGEVDEPQAQAEILVSRIALAGDSSPAALELRNRLARIYEVELGDVPTALELWKQILAIEPDDKTALAGLETQLDGDDYALPAAEILAPLYTARQAHDRMAFLLDVQLRFTDDPVARLDIYDRLATIHETDLSDEGAAYGTLERALGEFLGESSLMERVFALAGSLQTYADLADRLEALAADHDDPTVIRDTLVRVAEIREEHLSDVEAATDLWRQILELDGFDRQAIDALERLYGSQEQWPQLVEILLRKSELPDVAGDLGQRKALLFRAASLYETEMEEAEEAIEVLQSVLLVDPAEADAIEHLERLFARAERWEDLVENYERKLSLATSDAVRRELYFTLGAVLERELSDPERAIEAYRSITAFAPNDLDALRALDRLYSVTESWHDLLDVLGRQVDLVDDVEQARNIRYRMGRLNEVELADALSALETYRGLLAEDPTHPQTREALALMIDRGEEALTAGRILEPIYRIEGRWDDLVSVSRTLIEFADIPEERRDILVDIARICEQHLEDPASSHEALSQAARESLRVSELDEIERLSEVLGVWDQTAVLFAELWDEAIDPSMRTSIGLRCAAIRETRLGDVDGAIAAYSRVHEDDPMESTSITSLDRLYGETEAWEALAETLQKRISVCADAAEGVALRLRLGAVFNDRMGESAEAVSIYRDVLAQDQANSEAIRALEHMVAADIETYEISLILDPLYRELERWSELVELNAARARSEDSPDERYRLYLDSADVLETKLERPIATLDAVGAALREHPGDESLKMRIEALAEANDAWGRLVSVYRSILEDDLGEPERLDISLRTADIYDGRLADPNAAEAAYRAALDVEPGSERALRALVRLLTEQELWEELESVLGRLREVVYDPAELISLAFQHAKLHEIQLHDLGAAIETYGQVLDLDPAHMDAMDALIRLYTSEAMHEELFDAYDRRLQLHGDPDERYDMLVKMATLSTVELGRPDEAIDLWTRVLELRSNDATALDNLASLYRDGEAYAELADILDRQIALADDAEARVALLHQSGYLWAESLDNPDVAIERYRAVLDLIGDEPTAMSALRVLYERTSDQENFAATVERLLELDRIDDDERPAIYEQLGEIYTDILLKPDDAIRAWTLRTELVPHDEHALDRLEGLHTQQGQWEACISVLEKKIALTPEDADKVELLRRVASIWHDQLQNMEQATASFERILDLDLEDFEAYSGLERLYETLESWDAMVGLYLDRLEVTEDPWERLDYLRKASGVYETRLSNLDGAFLIQSKAAQEAPFDDDVLAELQRLAEAAQKHDELAEIYRMLIDQVAADPEHGEQATLPLLLAVGRLQDQVLGRPEFAEPYYDRALGFDPENEHALVALESIYERIEEWESLVGILKRRANLAFESTEQTAFYRRVGELYENQLDDISEATESYKMVVRIDDADKGGLTALQRIYDATGQWRELVDVLEKQADLTYEPQELVELRFRVGGLWRTELDVPDRAIDAFSEVLNVAPDHVPSMVALEDIYRKQENWERYIDITDSRLQVESDPAAQADIYFNQAMVYEQAFDDVNRAVDCLNRVLMVDAHHIPSIEELERIFVEQERFVDLVETYDRHANALADDPERRAIVLANLARTYIDALGDVPRAIETYERILEFQTDDAVALERLGNLYENDGNAQAAIDAYERLSAVSATTQNKVRFLLRAGEILEAELQDLDRAEKHYRSVLSMDPNSTNAMQALQRVFMARGLWTDAVDMIDAQIDQTRDLRERSSLIVQKGRINEEHTENLAAAQLLYEEALELDPRNVYAAGPLAEMYYQQQKWERARSALELLVDSEEYEKDDATQLQLFAWLGRVNEELGVDDDATKWYEAVLDIQVAEYHASLGLARLYRRADRLDDAYSLYRDVLSAHRDGLDPAETVQLYFEAGSIKRTLGELGSAQEMFERALEYDPAHLPSLKTLVELFDDAGDVRSSVRAKERLLEHTEDARERFMLLIDVGGGKNEMGDVPGAEKAYREALEVDPDSRVILQKLIELYSNAGNWKRVTEVIGKLAAMEADTQRKAKYLFTIGTIFRDELADIEMAIQMFDSALDCSIDMLDPFEAIDKLLTERREWKELERSYRRMLERVPATADRLQLRFILARNLGLIYRDRLQDSDKAIAAFKLASQLQPDDASLLEILADIYEKSGASGEVVIREHQKLIAVSPFRVESYKALFAAYIATGAFDRAWCMASALTILQGADPKEEEFYNRYLSPNVKMARVPLNNERLRKLNHPELDEPLSAIFGILATHLRSELALDLKRWNVHRRKDKRDLNEQTPLTSMVRYAMQELNVVNLTVYENADLQGIHNAVSDPPAVIAGGDVGRVKERELAFIVTKAITLMRPEFYLASAFPSTEHLKPFLYAAIAMHTQQIVGDVPVEAVQNLLGHMQHIPEPVRVQLQQHVANYINSGRNADLSAWLRNVDHTANRTALLLSGDLMTAIRCLKNESTVIGKASTKDKVRELILFSISDEYAELRSELDLALRQR